jgi:hypothetical protein
MPAPVAALYAYHSRPASFQRLLPPWLDVRVIGQPEEIVDGSRFVFEVRCGLSRRPWVSETRDHVKGRQFTDIQVEGPLVSWEHTRRFLKRSEGESELVDHVDYRLPARRLIGAPWPMDPMPHLQRIFRFRHARTRLDLMRHSVWSARPRLKVAVAGAGGLIGQALVAYLRVGGHEVHRLVRRPATAYDEISWDPGGGRLDPEDLEGVDAIVNLAGVSLSSLWTTRRKEAIRASRVDATTTLVAAMRRMRRPPSVFVSASAIGAYGSCGDALLTEATPRGSGFLAEVCEAWEAAALTAGIAGLRVVTPRFAIVVAGSGGVLASMLPVFRSGLGGRVGDGRQWWSWVELDDLLAALEWMIHDDALSGVVNVAAPEPVTNREFTQIMSRVLHRPAVLWAPRPFVRRFGGMADEMLLASQRVVPEQLTQRGFRFAFGRLESALRHQLGR